MKIEIDMSELSTFGRMLVEAAPKQATSAVRAVTRAEGGAVKSRAQASAPRDRGWLAQAGIRMKTWNNPEGPSVSVFTTTDPEGRPVGFYQEYGTTIMPPQAFMAPAVIPAERSYPAAVLAKVDPFAPAGTDTGGGDE